MEVRPGDKSERELVEDYISKFTLSEMLDEVLNALLEERPENPYTALGKLIEAKTMPEIIEIKLYPISVEGGAGGVEAKVITNLGEFTGSAADSFDAPPGSDTLRAFGLEEAKIQVIKEIDPREQSKIDEALDNILELDVSVSIAVSKACARAGARHSGVPLYNFIATMGETVELLPLPVLSACQLQYAGPSATNKMSQEILVYPVGASFFDGAMEGLIQAHQLIKTKIAESNIQEDPDTPLEGNPTPINMVNGVIRVRDMPITELVDFVMSAIKGNITGEYLPAVEYGHTSISKFVDDALSYFPDGFESQLEGAEKSSQDVVEAIIATWRQLDVVSIEDPLHPTDLDGLRMLKEKIAGVMEEIRGDGASTELPYALRGVGGDASCPVQVVADEAVSTPDAIKKWEAEAIFNTLKIRMSKCKTVTAAVNLAKAARQAGWQVIIGVEEGMPDSQDDFLADLAVGVAASQFQGGGMESGEHLCKFNRLLQISRENEDIKFAGRQFR